MAESGVERGRENLRARDGLPHLGHEQRKRRHHHEQRDQHHAGRRARAWDDAQSRVAANGLQQGRRRRGEDEVRDAVTQEQDVHPGQQPGRDLARPLSAEVVGVVQHFIAALGCAGWARLALPVGDVRHRHDAQQGNGGDNQSENPIHQALFRCSNERSRL
ncbi:MAG: hypothetical protein M5R40_09180 [Anaerolineae bacterium]|nr:hypothetical protein [Anaerolineae bacterium]